MKLSEATSRGAGRTVFIERNWRLTTDMQEFESKVAEHGSLYFPVTSAIFMVRLKERIRDIHADHQKAKEMALVHDMNLWHNGNPDEFLTQPLMIHYKSLTFSVEGCPRIIRLGD